MMLMAACLWALSCCYCRPVWSPNRFLVQGVLFGLLLGIFTVTRVLPIILLPAAWLALWPRAGKQRAAHFAVGSTLLVALVVGSAMGANLLRFGRFELSNSTGRHLWNAISPTADVMLAHSPDYAALREQIPDIQGRMTWQFDYEQCPDAVRRGRDKETFLKLLSKEAITSHPWMFLKRGLTKTREYLLRYPERWEIALWAPPGDYPIGVAGFLPPLIPALAPLRGVLDQIDAIASRFYGRIVMLTALIVSIGGVMTLAARPWCVVSAEGQLPTRVRIADLSPVTACFVATQLTLLAWTAFFRRPLGQVAPYACLMLGYYLGWRGGPGRHADLRQSLAGVRRFSQHVPYALFLLSTFFVSCGLCWSVETPVTRYTMPYLPALSLAAALAACMVVTFLRPAR